MTKQITSTPPIGWKEFWGEVVAILGLLVLALTPYQPFTSLSMPIGHTFANALSGPTMALLIGFPLFLFMFTIHLNRFKLLNRWFVLLVVLPTIAFELLGRSQGITQQNLPALYAVMGLILMAGCMFETLRRLTQTK